jgi:hypothetical protein
MIKEHRIRWDTTETVDRCCRACVEVYDTGLEYRAGSGHKKVESKVPHEQQRMIRKRPTNVPQQYANHAAHARYALHAR